MLLQTIRRLKWDSLGGVLSFLCLIHCLVLPLLVALLPFALLLDESVHAWLFLALAPVAGQAAWSGFRKHQQTLPAATISVGVLLIGMTAFAPFGETSEVALTVAGSLLLIAGHIHNGRLTLLHGLVMQQL